jgi:hypothetical protein
MDGLGSDYFQHQDGGPQWQSGTNRCEINPALQMDKRIDQPW